ncbi:MAG: hypothetical protein ACI4M9_07185 [Succinivibrio sp.]
MNLAEQRQRLLDYLHSKIFHKTIYDIAKKRLILVNLAVKDDTEPSLEEIKQYIRDHYDELQAHTETTLKDLVKEILPDEGIMGKIKRGCQLLLDLGILSVLLLPVLYVCVKYSIIKYHESGAISECADGIISCIFVLFLLGFSIYGYFRNK